MRLIIKYTTRLQTGGVPLEKVEEIIRTYCSKFTDTINTGNSDNITNGTFHNEILGIFPEFQHAITSEENIHS